MTYFGFLASFVALPIGLLSLLVLRDVRRNRGFPLTPGGSRPWLILGLLVIVALVYTTPWDNYLVATRVWWYQPRLVTGITFGWVPLEEYTFFVLQPILIVLWCLWVARRAPTASQSIGWPARILLMVLLAGVWIGALVTLFAGWPSASYLGLELAWALPPLFIQVVVGAVALAQQRWLLLFTVIPVTIYLSMTDSIAISLGIWTINPARSLGVMLGKLPLEEGLFFLLTTTLVSIGFILAHAAQKRVLFRLKRSSSLEHIR